MDQQPLNFAPVLAADGTQSLTMTIRIPGNRLPAAVNSILIDNYHANHKDHEPPAHWSYMLLQDSSPSWKTVRLKDQGKDDLAEVWERLLTFAQDPGNDDEGGARNSCRCSNKQPTALHCRVYHGF